MTNVVEDATPLKTVFCAIQHLDRDPWKTIRDLGSRQTWLKEFIPNEMKVVFFSGIPLSPLVRRLEIFHEKVRWSALGRILPILDYLFFKPFCLYVPVATMYESKNGESDLIVQCPDAFVFLNNKFLGLYRYFLDQTDCDYLYTTTTGSYLQPKIIVDLCQQLPDKDVYAGSILNAGKRKFISGANRLMSRDVVQRLVNERRLLNPVYLEDLSQGIVLEKIGVPFHETPTINLHSLDELFGKNKQEVLANFHFRIKSYTDRSLNDVEIMQQLHRILQSK